MVHVYCAKMLVPSLHLDDSDPGADPIRAMKLEQILPSQEDLNVSLLQFIFIFFY